jgi:hypothetical protein
MNKLNFEWPEQLGYLDLDDITSYTEVSGFASGVCRANNLFRVSDLLAHYAEDPDFLTLRRVNTIARDHLQNICGWLLEHRYLLLQELAEPSADEIAPHRFSVKKLRFLDIKFKERYEALLLNQSLLGFRELFERDYTYQKCHQVFFEGYVDLKGLRNVGGKTISEVKNFLKAVRAEAFMVLKQSGEEFDSHPEVQLHRDSIDAPLPADIAPERFSVAKIKKLNTQIAQWFGMLPARAQTGLNFELKDPTDYVQLYRVLMTKDKLYERIRNIGKHTAKDLEVFAAKIGKLATELLQQPDQEFEDQTAQDQIFTAFHINADTLAPYLDADTEENRFPLFRYLHELILDKLQLDDDAMLVIRDRLGWFRSDELYPQEALLYKKINLPSYRIRQLSRSVQEQIVNPIYELSRHNALFTRIVRQYHVSEHSDVVLLSSRICEDINRLENTDFSLRFFYAIFSARCAWTHAAFGHQNVTSLHKYLVKHAFLKIFDVEAFFWDIETIIFADREHDYAVYWPTYVAGFLKPDHSPADAERATKAARVLAEAEFESFMVFSNENEALFPRRSKKKLWEYAFEALETIGNPASVELIRETILDKYPDMTFTPATLRQKIITDKEHFITISLSGLYGLVKWETERPDIRGGSIRSIIAEYLRNSGQPKHCQEITDHVLPFRPGTSYQSIQTSLKADKSGRFVELPGNFWTSSSVI